MRQCPSLQELPSFVWAKSVIRESIKNGQLIVNHGAMTKCFPSMHVKVTWNLVSKSGLKPFFPAISYTTLDRWLILRDSSWLHPKDLHCIAPLVRSRFPKGRSPRKSAQFLLALEMTRGDDEAIIADQLKGTRKWCPLLRKVFSRWLLETHRVTDSFDLSTCIFLRIFLKVCAWVRDSSIHDTDGSVLAWGLFPTEHWKGGMRLGGSRKAKEKNPSWLKQFLLIHNFVQNCSYI